jgi:hypothetical protein
LLAWYTCVSGAVLLGVGVKVGEGDVIEPHTASINSAFGCTNHMTSQMRLNQPGRASFVTYSAGAAVTKGGIAGEDSAVVLQHTSAVNHAVGTGSCTRIGICATQTLR